MSAADVRLIAWAELKAIAVQVPETPAPPVLYAPVDPGELHDVLVRKALPSVALPEAADASLDAYALPLLQRVLADRRSMKSSAPAMRFADAVRDLQPVGTRFTANIVRLYGTPACATQFGCTLGLRVRELSLAMSQARQAFALHAAVYDETAQRSLLLQLYEMHEDYFVAACDRFGALHADDLLHHTWDAFRRAAGQLLPRFRPPSAAGAKEWIAMAPYRKPAPVLCNRRGMDRPLPLTAACVDPALPATAQMELAALTARLGLPLSEWHEKSVAVSEA